MAEYPCETCGCRGRDCDVSRHGSEAVAAWCDAYALFCEEADRENDEYLKTPEGREGQDQAELRLHRAIERGEISLW